MGQTSQKDHDGSPSNTKSSRCVSPFVVKSITRVMNGHVYKLDCFQTYIYPLICLHCMTVDIEGPEGQEVIGGDEKAIKACPNCTKNHLLNQTNGANSSQVEKKGVSLSGSSGISQGLLDSRSVTSYRDLRISFFTNDPPTTVSQPPSITIRIKPDEQGRFGFNVKVRRSSF